MSFWKKLFGGGGDSGSAPAPTAHGEAVEHKGFTIQPAPYKEGSEYQTCAIISKEIGGEVKEHRMIRADRFPSVDLACEQALRKARQTIDEQGEAIFR
ncbi:HlyU family transcriptional regulator [Nitratireductor basaltis]|uniref:Transcription activator HlyU n=1 Tax=Nitratireductor basaltis TaxID=472175 RepID=A0A084U9E6_9HYPH|nr:HlyU family transcriptional regulator [Nitratireductor basaltis]KFB09582.1 Transcription activator HlyU [Nitratireductor basaltis]